MKTVASAIFLAFVLVLPAAVQEGSASPYPEHPIRVIVPFTPGGGADLIARTVAQKLTEQLGQQLVIDNRVGASGNIGTEMAAHALPDGYTILMGYVGNLSIGPTLHKHLPFDPLRDFVPITELAEAPNILVVNPSFPAKTFEQFIGYVKANPMKVNFASAVPGSTGHLAGGLLRSAAGIEMVHIPYKGAAQAIVDLMGGQVQAMFGVSTVMPHIKSGKLRALATTGLRRTPSLPQLPTIAELGFPGFEAVAWYGFLVPAHTPRAIISRLHDETVRALPAPDLKVRLEAAGFILVGSTPEAFAAYIRAETKKWASVIKATGMKVD